MEAGYGRVRVYIRRDYLQEPVGPDSRQTEQCCLPLPSCHVRARIFWAILGLQRVRRERREHQRGRGSKQSEKTANTDFVDVFG